jgi:hypothetical protein
MTAYLFFACLSGSERRIDNRGRKKLLRQSPSCPSARLAPMLPSLLMLTDQIVSLLIAERDKLNRAIEALQGTKRRGRPPKSGIALTASAPSRGGRRGRTFTSAQRKAQAKRMKEYWAAKKKKS